MKNLKQNSHKILLIFILSLAFLVRTYNLADVPAGFFGDEAAIGYNAYSILHTGKDEFGASFPLFFESFGDYKPGLSIYSTIPFVMIFGLNETSVRLQSVFYGMLTLVLLYLLSRELFGKNKAILTTAAASTMPWLIHYNRTGFELNSYAALFTGSVYLLTRATKNKSYLVPAFIACALTFYSYYSAKLLVPLMMIGTFIIYKKGFLVHKKELLIALSVFILISIPVIQSFMTGSGIARFNAVSVFSAHLPLKDTLLRIINNYFFQLSPALWLNGEPTPITRHFAGGLKPLLLITVPFFYIGIIYLIKTWKTKKSQTLLWWLILYPVGAAVVAESPFTGRTVIGAPLSAILIALGISFVIKLARERSAKLYIASAISILISLNFILFANFYFTKYPLYSSGYWGWQYGPKHIVNYFKDQENKYDEEIMIPEFNAPHIFFKFYAPGGCGKCRLGTPHESYKPSLKQLFAVTPLYLQEHPEINFFTLKTIFYPDGNTAFLIGNAIR